MKEKNAAQSTCPMFDSDAPPLAHVVTSSNTPFPMDQFVSDRSHTIIFGSTRYGMSRKEEGHEKTK
ncbi:hypothetical protein [Scandinavium goeteborgense]|uniref:Uncharacterized protein n=1 Tax=Scandinavium goeteborgense TaxID=1851514 RepID=A0A4R6DUH4_SCAGO|nr:hypothetical protein [Scandinavium goeteborgense]TDN48855.1 hypothetical protein EC847_12522 [Scandinavium goeteborgense]